MKQALQLQIATSLRSRVVSTPALAMLVCFSALTAAHAQTNYQRIKSFGFPEFAGWGPSSALIEGSDGNLYGTDWAETVFRLRRDGSGYTVLHKFNAIDGGRSPNGVVEGNDGALYATTQYGGSSDAGTVFKINKDGSGFGVLRTFTRSSGRWPTASLVVGNDGALYGTTSAGGPNDLGTVFKINPDGSGYSVLHGFMGGQDAAGPSKGLVKGSDGTIYGTTDYGGNSNFGGGVFKLNPDGSGYAVLHPFNGSGGDGFGSKGLMLGSDGLFYGTTESGGNAGGGTVFKLDPDAPSYTILHNFTGTDGHGTAPQPGLIEGNDGAFYGTTEYGGDVNLGTVFKVNRDGNGYAILHSFNFVVGGGYYPQAGLVKGSDGALYGTTSGGGSTQEGTVFKLDQDGTGYLLLHNFSGTGGDGAGPQAVLAEGSDGILYGTTSSGGVTNADYPYGLGTVFRLKPDGSGYVVLRRFTGVGGDGISPRAGLVEGSDGALYGTTYAGGLTDPISNPDGFGTVFKLNRDGSGYTVLRRFTGIDGDGSNPQTVLAKGSNGKLYGTTSSGGSYAGTVFKLEQDGSGYAVLRSFRGSATDGSVPNGLVIGKDGALYGTTTSGGDMGLGAVFKLLSSPPQLIFADIQLGGAGVLLSLAGAPPGHTCQIQAATNLNSTFWQIIGTNTADIDGKVQFLDTGASNYPLRFYRTAAQ